MDGTAGSRIFGYLRDPLRQLSRLVIHIAPGGLILILLDDALLPHLEGGIAMALKVLQVGLHFLRVLQPGSIGRASLDGRRLGNSTHPSEMLIEDLLLLFFLLGVRARVVAVQATVNSLLGVLTLT